MGPGEIFRRATRHAGYRRGMAIPLVIVVLMGLVLITTPFAISMALHENRARKQLAQTQAQLAAEGAIQTALAALQKQPEALKVDLEGLSGLASAARGSPVNLQDPKGLMWAVRLEDEQGKVNLNSAPPALLGNLFGSSCLAEPVLPGAAALVVYDASRFRSDGDPKTVDGAVRLGYDLVPYLHAEGNTIVLAPAGGEYVVTRAYPAGQLVADARGFFASEHKFRRGEKEFLPFRSIYALKDIGGGDPRRSVAADEFLHLSRYVTIHSDRDRSAEWGRREQVLEQFFDADRESFTVTDNRQFGSDAVVRLTRGTNPVTYNRIKWSTHPHSRQNNRRIAFTGPVGISQHSSGQEGQFREALGLEPELPHPINVNTAPYEVLAAVFKGVRLRGGQYSTVIDQTAYALAREIRRRTLGGYKFRSAEDFAGFLEEMQKQGLITAGQRQALYLNATESCSSYLDHWTTTFCYRPARTYTLEGTGVVNNPAGLQLARHTVCQVVSLRVEKPGHFWVRSQADWEEVLDHGTYAKVVTFPVNTGRITQRVSRRKTHPPDTSTRPGVGYAQLETGKYWRNVASGRCVFYDSFSDGTGPGYQPDGFNLNAKGGSLQLPGSLLGAERRGLGLSPASLEFWFKAPQGYTGGYAIADFGQAAERNRVLVEYTGKELIVAVWDNSLEGGRTRPTEYRFPCRLAPDRWHHISCAWYGSQPGNADLRLDGHPIQLTDDYLPDELYMRPATRLAANLGDDLKSDVTLSVEDTSDFPPAGAVRVGQEIIEYQGKTATSFENCRRGARWSAAVKHQTGQLVVPFGYRNYTLQDVYRGGARLAQELTKDIDDYRCRVDFGGDRTKKVEKNATSIPVKEVTAKMPRSGYAVIGGEAIYYGGRSATTLTSVKRGLFGTTVREHRDNTRIYVASLEVDNLGEYAEDAEDQLVAVVDAQDQRQWEWLRYYSRERQGGKSYFVAHLSFSWDARTQVRSASCSWAGWRNQYSMGVLEHKKGTKLLPVLRMREPWCGTHDSIFSRDGLDEVTVCDDNPDHAEVRRVKYGRWHHWLVHRWIPTPPPKGSWVPDHWDYWFRVSLDDWTRRTYRRAEGARMIKSPTGLLPLVHGGSFHFGETMDGGNRLGAVVDEVRVVNSLGEPGVVATDTDCDPVRPGDTSLRVEGGRWPGSGFARLGEEIIYYSGTGRQDVTRWYAPAQKLASKRLSPTKGCQKTITATVLQNVRRGLFGTSAGNHEPGTPVTPLDAWQASVLARGVDANDDRLALENAAGFGEEGCGLVGSEVISWSKKRGNELFIAPWRGRYGTAPAGHSAGDPVLIQPYRYYDRYKLQYDGPGMAYVQLAHAAKDVIWDRLDVRLCADLGALVQVVAVVRFDGAPTWDSKAAFVPRPGQLFACPVEGMEATSEEGCAIPLGVRADEIEVRLYWRYLAGAFDAGDEWKRCPGIDAVKISYHAPQILRRRDEPEH